MSWLRHRWDPTQALAIPVLGLVLSLGCGQSVPVALQEQDGIPTPSTITLYFDGDLQTFDIRDLAVALALLINPFASVSEIQQVGQDIFGLTLSPEDITGADPNPLDQFDLDGNGIPGDLADFGVALAALLGATSETAVGNVCQDLLRIPCALAPNVGIPGPGATPSPTEGLELEVSSGLRVLSPQSLNTVQVSNNGIPVADAVVNWSVLSDPGEPGISLLFPQSVTDENGIAYTILDFSSSSPILPFTLNSRLVAQVEGKIRSAAIPGGVVGGSGGLMFRADSPIICQLGEEVVVPVSGIPDFVTTVPLGITPDFASINPRIATSGEVTILAEPPQETRLFEVVVNCREVGTTSFVIRRSLNSLPLIEVQVLPPD